MPLSLQSSVTSTRTTSSMFTSSIHGSLAEKNKQRSGLPGAVSHFYYKHGLFLSSYPTCASSIAIVVILLSCYPLINIPLPGTIPTKILLPFEGKYSLYGEEERNYSLVKNVFYVNNFSTYEPRFLWAQNVPMFYVQQITFRSSVLPWTDEMQLMDAFRAPLYEVFKLLEIVRNHESENHRTLDKICLHVENVRHSPNEQIFPEYNCLVLSPANLWEQNVQNFNKDTNLLNTIFQYHNIQKSKVSTAEMLFGLPMQDTGFKRYPLRSRTRIVQYALTLILKQNDREYIKSLKAKLLKYYPAPAVPSSLRSSGNQQQLKEKSSITYIFYPGELKIWELTPICLAFLLLFTYIYFSVRKIDVIRSRIVLALCAVITVLGSLVMSLGLCFFFGLTISLQSKDIFPYLVVLVGLENCLVITKSVVSTDEAFDVKIRVAQALSKEGWHISKTLLTEITILTIGICTFVPVIQEFCIFAIVGLLSDFMLQMLLFSTILAMNIKRVEYTMEAKNLPKMLLSYTCSSDLKNSRYQQYARNQARPEFRFFSHASFGATSTNTTVNSNGFSSTSFQRSQSHPKLSIDLASPYPAAADLCKRSSLGNRERIPKRLKLVNFWARTRFFQRAFMVWMSVWICSIAYNSGCLENLFVVEVNRTAFRSEKVQRNMDIAFDRGSSFFSNVQHVLNSASTYTSSLGSTEHKTEFLKTNSALVNKTFSANGASDYVNKTDAELRRLLYPDFELNYFLSNFHWSTIMKQYNISLSGRYITILPTIKLSRAISPEITALVRNPNEQVVQNFQWKALAAALDPLDFSDSDNRESPLVPPGVTPLFPKSPMEIFFAVTLCCISTFVLCYAMLVFYRCICTRNYAEWRSSWNESSEFPQKTEQILEGVPTQIAGHKHKIECLVSDGVSILSCCLKGEIKIWDARSGENVATIQRSYIQIPITDEDGNILSIKVLPNSPIWCLDYYDNLIAVGCANGRIELWESTGGLVKCAFQEDSKRNQGITNIHLNGDRVIVARLCGRLDFCRLETYYKGKQIDWNFTSAYRRTHLRTGSTGSIRLMHQQQDQNLWSDPQSITREQIKCTLKGVRFAHQQPITCMQVVNDMVFTGSKDHTLKVYSLNNSDLEYTLHGHRGPITCLFVDYWQPGTGGSGSQDGLLCVWDLFTGACMYNIQAHDGAVSNLACAPSYVISLGTDERICVWERFQGNLLTTINISNTYSSLLMLTPSLLVTSKTGSLIVWDVRTGEPAREVKLDRSNSQLSPKIMLLTYDSVICDYGTEIRVVRFPIVDDKCN